MNSLFKETVAEGKQIGLLEEDILQIIKLQVEPKISKIRTFFKYFIFAIKIFVVLLIAIIFTIAFAAATFEYSSFIIYTFKSFDYSILKAFRYFALLYLRHYNTESNILSSFCLVNNPWYPQRFVECGSNDRASKRHIDAEEFNEGDFETEFYATNDIIIINGGSATATTYNKLRNDILKEPFLFNSYHKFYVNNSKLDLGEMLKMPESEVIARGSIQVKWALNSVTATRVLRRHSPPPRKIELSNPISLLKHLYIYSSDASFTLDYTFHNLRYGIQASGSGSYKATFRNITCSGTRQMFDFHLKEGDIFLYLDSMWEISKVTEDHQPRTLGILSTGSYE